MKVSRLIISTVLFLLMGVTGFAQTIKVAGTVTDATNGEPLVGVAIVVEGTTNGTSTDADGTFTLNAPRGAVLEVSCIGYATIRVAAAETLELSLGVDTEYLDDVVVTGYMTEKKADLTGSVAVVRMDEVADIPTGNILSALQGRVAGMSITTDGTPGGAGSSSRIRGTTTINDSSPLYVIDGVMTREDIGTIVSSNDIESIQVLKDAASAAIYGAQAANGVIIVTTKRAREGEIRINFNASLSLQIFNRGIELLDAQQWGDAYWAAYDYDYGTTPVSLVYGSGPKAELQLGKPYYDNGKVQLLVSDTDWYDECYRPALMQNYSLSMSKGDKNHTSSLSFNYIDQTGVLKGSDYTSFGTRVNNEFRFLNNRVKVGESLNITYWTRHDKPNGYEPIERQLIKQHPAQAVWASDGTYAGAEMDLLGANQNPIRYIDNQASQINKSWRIFGNAYIDITPIKNLTIRSQYGVNFNTNYQNTFTPAWDEHVRFNTDNTLSITSRERLEWVWTNTASYALNKGKHSASFLLGGEWKKNRTDTLTGTGTDFALADRNYVYLSVAEGTKDATNSANIYAMLSYFAKANYSYAEKYLFSATVRRDASSRFGSENNAGIFPSASLGWRLSKEGFMSGTKSWLSDLKLRASWGINGNDQINNTATYNMYAVQIGNGSYNLNGDGNTLAMGSTRSQSGNSFLRWEQTEQVNVGLDMAFLNNRLNINADYFDKNTTDMIYQLPVPAVNGEGGTSYQNCAAMKNNGFELVAIWKDTVGDFGYELAGNISAYRNKITYLPEDIYYTYGCGDQSANITNVGLPYGGRIGYVVDGIFRTQAEVDAYTSKYDVQFGKPAVGRLMYNDVNGDGIIDTKDKAYIGSDNPVFEAGLNVSLFWKGFDLTMFFSGMVRDAYNTSKEYLDLFGGGEGLGNHAARVLESADAWYDYKATGTYTGKNPALSTMDNNLETDGNNTWYVEDGSYLKLKNMTLGYTIPRNVVQKLNIRDARVYLQAQNLFTLTKYTGPDPEALGYPYPFARQFTFGLRIGF